MSSHTGSIGMSKGKERGEQVVFPDGDERVCLWEGGMFGVSHNKLRLLWVVGSRVKTSDVTSSRRSYSLNMGSIRHHMERVREPTRVHVQHPHMNVHVVVVFCSGLKTHLKKHRRLYCSVSHRAFVVLNSCRGEHKKVSYVLYTIPIWTGRLWTGSIKRGHTPSHVNEVHHVLLRFSLYFKFAILNSHIDSLRRQTMRAVTSVLCGI